MNGKTLFLVLACCAPPTPTDAERDIRANVCDWLNAENGSACEDPEAGCVVVACNASSPEFESCDREGFAITTPENLARAEQLCPNRQFYWDSQPCESDPAYEEVVFCKFAIRE